MHTYTDRVLMHFSFCTVRCADEFPRFIKKASIPLDGGAKVYEHRGTSDCT